MAVILKCHDHADVILAGQADYYYPNDQSTRFGWYHDHAHGITRINAYAGLASGYLLLDEINDAYVAAGKIPGLASTLPLIFQDKVFVHAGTAQTDPTWAAVARADVQAPGSLCYEHVYDPEVFEVAPGGKPLPNPSAVPEFFGDTRLCNRFRAICPSMCPRRRAPPPWDSQTLQRRTTNTYGIAISWNMKSTT